MKDYEYKDLKEFSDEVKISEDNLLKIYNIESYYHNLILLESDKENRKELCSKLYGEIHHLMNSLDSKYLKNEKEFRVKLFYKYLVNKSILDVGCGNGNFLKVISEKVKFKELVGIDIFDFYPNEKNIEFINGNIVDFSIGKKFDLIFSDNVIEHIPPQDLEEHLNILKDHLNEYGKIIFITPNRLFGPHDVTRIIDNSYKGKIKSRGSHLNELSYTEFSIILDKVGFTKKYSIFPIYMFGYKVYSIKIPIQIFKFIEGNKILLNFFYLFGKQSIYKMPIIIICEK